MNVSMNRITASPLANRRHFRSPSATPAYNRSRSLSSVSSSTYRAQLSRSSRDESQKKLDKHEFNHSNSRSSVTLPRPLPKGPGPLPNKFKLNDRQQHVRYVPANGSDYSCAKSSSTGLALSSKHGHTDRKVSDDSGYGSSCSSSKDRTRSKPSTSTASCSIASGRRSKSITNLNSEFSELSVYSNRDDRGQLNKSVSYKNSSSSSGSGLSKRTRTLSDVSRATDQTSIYLKSNARVEDKEDYSSDNNRIINQRLSSGPSVSSTSKTSGRYVADYYSTDNSTKEFTNTDHGKRSCSRSSSSSPVVSTQLSLSSKCVSLTNKGVSNYLN